MFPAPAGMNLPQRRISDSMGCVPRASGDEPQSFTQMMPTAACSPRQRG